MAEKYLTVDQAAKMLQLNPQTVRRMLKAGRLPGVKLGPREWRLNRDELERFLSAQGPKPPEK